jgi:hypothetical protein
VKHSGGFPFESSPLGARCPPLPEEGLGSLPGILALGARRHIGHVTDLCIVQLPSFFPKEAAETLCQGAPRIGAGGQACSLANATPSSADVNFMPLLL